MLGCSLARLGLVGVLFNSCLVNVLVLAHSDSSAAGMPETPEASPCSVFLRLPGAFTSSSTVTVAAALRLQTETLGLATRGSGSLTLVFHSRIQVTSGPRGSESLDFLPVYWNASSFVWPTGGFPWKVHPCQETFGGRSLPVTVQPFASVHCLTSSGFHLRGALLIRNTH